ncbi:MAG: hypothetical protein Greene07147_701 [Parcubacteria group bacterium Greene0714_7]|nr:MAG: hypothetical protein Greene07147_701 [Parcubacteria group bacterium Greene0714_7]
MGERFLTPKRTDFKSQIADSFLVFEIEEYRSYRGQPIGYNFARRIAARLRRRQENKEAG